MKVTFMGYEYTDLKGNIVNKSVTIIKQRIYNEFYAEDSNIIFEEGTKVNVNGYKVKIEEVIREINGDVIYYTNKYKGN